MPNVDHVAWLNEGIDAWNTRRETNAFLPDFSGPSEVESLLHDCT